jgi:hypothetical protein
MNALRSSLLALAIVTTPLVAAAGDVDPAARSAARALGYAGVDAYERHDYETAVDKLEKAFAVLRVPSVGLWSARALAKRGRLVQASERYRLVGTLPTSGGDVAIQQQAQTDAARELAELLPRIPSIVVTIDGARPSQVTIDDVAVPMSLVGEPIPADPGTHRIVVRQGDETAATSVVLQESEKKQAMLRLARTAPHVATEPALAPAPPPSSGSWQRSAGFVTLGFGGVALATGAITGLVALGKKQSFDSDPACHDDLCPSSQGADVDAYNRLRVISTVGFVAGGALAGAGAVLLLTSPRSQERVSVRATPAGIDVRGTF